MTLTRRKRLFPVTACATAECGSGVTRRRSLSCSALWLHVCDRPQERKRKCVFRTSRKFCAHRRERRAANTFAHVRELASGFSISRKRPSESTRTPAPLFHCVWGSPGTGSAVPGAAAQNRRLRRPRKGPTPSGRWTGVLTPAPMPAFVCTASMEAKRASRTA